jgi:chromatin remodeling complex protein RSC6
MSSTITETPILVEETVAESQQPQKLSPLEELLSMMDEQEQAQREFQNAYNHLNTIARNLKKAVQKYTKKEAKRGSARRARRLGLKDGEPRKPCGFEIPTSISDQLAVFLGREPGVQIARTEVTKAIAQYIRENNLKHPEKKRVIVPDAKLGAILGEGATDENLNHFSMNKYLTKHFPPKKIDKVDA